MQDEMKIKPNNDCMFSLPSLWGEDWPGRAGSLLTGSSKLSLKSLGLEAGSSAMPGRDFVGNGGLPCNIAPSEREGTTGFLFVEW